MTGFWISIGIIIFTVLVFVVWCLFAENPREQQENEKQIRYVDEWLNNKNKK